MSDQATNGDYTIENLLRKAAVVVYNAELPEIIEHMAPIGYTMERVQEGKGLYSNAEELTFAREKEFGEQMQATADFNVKLETAQKVYMKNVKFMRIQLENNVNGLVSLGLNGRRKTTNSGFYKQAKQFYNNLLSSEELLAEATEINITPDKLHGDLQMVLEAERADEAQDSERGDVQNATRRRDEAIEELFDWTARYKKLARLALEDMPQFLEKLGIVVE